MESFEKTIKPLTDLDLTAEYLLPDTPVVSLILNYLICLATVLLSIRSVFLFL